MNINFDIKLSRISMLWLIPVSFCFYSLYNVLLNAFLVKWGCKLLLGDRMCFIEAPLTANGEKYNQNRVNSFDKKVITKGDIAEISHWILSQAASTIISIGSIIALWQAKEDVLHKKVWFVVPLIHWGAWYYPVDMYAMFRAYMLRKNLTSLSLKKQLGIFVTKKWALVIHHLVLFGIAYPLIAVYIDNYTKFGSFFICTFLVEDLTNPFISNAFVMKVLNLHHSLIYKLNGVVLAIIFITVRLLNLPLSILIYSAQYYNWNVLGAVSSMAIYCHIFNIGQFLLNFYWFSFMTRIAVSVLFYKSDHSKTSKKTQ